MEDPVGDQLAAASGPGDLRSGPDLRLARRGLSGAFVEYKPSPTLSLRAQLNLWDDFTQQRTVYATRNPRTVAFVEERSIDPRTFVSLRVRKTF